MSVPQLSGRSIGRRLNFSFSLVLLIALAGSAMGFWSLQKVADETASMYGETLLSERLASDWQRNIVGGIYRSTAIAVSKDKALAEYFSAAAAESTRQSSELQKRLDALLSSPRERQLFDQLSQGRQAYLAARDAMTQAKKADDAQRAEEIFTQQYLPAAGQFQDTIKQIVQEQRDELDAAAQRVAQTNSQARIALLVFAACALALGAFLALRLTRSIVRPLSQAAASADAIAHFDLSRHISVNSADETGQLQQAQKTMQEALIRLIGEVRSSTDSISTASAEIATGNHDLSARTEQTASNLQEAAASMAQLTGTVRQTAESAVTANQLASSAAEVARRGGTVVAEVVSTMEDISASSRRITDIIGTIDGIAFQTNILALNAAVEAARAGEQGRGFAVVASEVRSLAQRSAEAAKEIKTLIGASAERVESGTQLVQDAGSTMSDIVASVQRVSDIIAEISAASREQSEGINQVNNAVGQLDQMTQQNAALVEESAAAAESLRDQSGRLASAIAVFKL
ncbi:hypothetical protein DBR47_05525 [Paucibacter sp. KBW04]|uniref:methyl-accepting chemotaxis protein n=1 Tax=Paucibacter sp. KBW04 TaxID=2153361 RepID=UPI000F564A21|nr:methyl-accepting chemotaxis protein [Paucibacter sp. KBW04]RQO61974.1 hypothetical protein DBR47_05525 [Paucibacter sp. KBW04]